MNGPTSASLTRENAARQDGIERIAEAICAADKPFVLRGVHDYRPDQLLPAIDAVRTMLAHSRDDPENRLGRASARIRLFVDGRDAQNDEMARLARADELETWLRHLADTHGRDVGLAISNFHLFDREFLDEFLLPLLARVTPRLGIPAGETESAAFLGCYAHTPFGVHHDPGNAVLTLGVLGTKRMLLWPPGSTLMTGIPPLRVPTAEMRTAAVVLEAGPGDAMFWPANWYHVHETDHGPHAAVSVGWWYNAERAFPIAQAVQALLGDAGFHEGTFAAKGGLPEEINELADRLEHLVAQGSLRRQLEATWVQRQRRHGLSTMPGEQPPWFCKG